MSRKKTTQTTCVLYDPADGSIVLTHTVVNFGASKPVGRNEVEAEARSILSGRKLRRLKLKALHVAANAIRPGIRYQVSRGGLTAVK